MFDQFRHKARLRAWEPDKAMGRRAEDLAHRFLQGLGYTIVGRNFQSRTGTGEIDLIARDGDMLVFVEVKSRSSEQFGTPDRAVDEDKRSRIVRASWEYIRRSGEEPVAVRFDIVSVVFGSSPEIFHFPDAFGRRRSFKLH